MFLNLQIGTEEEVFTPRKGSRQRKPSAKALENALSRLKISNSYNSKRDTASADDYESDTSDQVSQKPASTENDQNWGCF